MKTDPCGAGFFGRCKKISEAEKIKTDSSAP